MKVKPDWGFTEKEVVMKFLMIVLAVHFMAEMISNKKKVNNNNDDTNENRVHPAEFAIRK
jgi:hypothetical protein